MNVRLALRQQGFTLLELLVVVAILAALSVSLVDIVQYQDDQQRFESTRTRLETVRFSIFGENPLEPRPTIRGIHNRQPLGYLVDNGRLPSSVAGLLGPEANESSYDLLEPIFDQTPHSNDLCTGLDMPDDIIGRVDDQPAVEDLRLVTFNQDFPSERLAKGYRGSYLPLQSGSAAFLDGWGEEINLDSSVSEKFVIRSNGSNKAIGATPDVDGEPNYSSELVTQINDSDWQHEIDGWGITVSLPGKNADGSECSCSDGNTCVGTGVVDLVNYGVSILLYENNNPEQHLNWRRISTDVIAHDMDVCGEINFAFIESLGTIGNNENLACRTWLPSGKHFLVLFRDDDLQPHIGSNEIPVMAMPFSLLSRGGAFENLEIEYAPNIDDIAFVE